MYLIAQLCLVIYIKGIFFILMPCTYECYDCVCVWWFSVLSASAQLGIMGAWVSSSFCSFLQFSSGLVLASALQKLLTKLRNLEVVKILLGFFSNQNNTHCTFSCSSTEVNF